MTSLIGGTFSDVLHSALASQLMTSSAQNSQKTSGTTSDSETSIYNAENNGNPAAVTLDLFKDGLFAALHPPPADVANSDTASSESPEPAAHQNHSENDNLDEHQSAALSLIQSFGTPIDVTSSSATSSADAFFSEATIRDLMPVLAAANGGGGHTMSTNSTTMMTSSGGGANATSSPSAWARNAGRKKSHPVWDFFKDMKDTTGTGGVICLHCTWTGDDRSPNNLRTHLKKFHTDDGIFNRFSEKLAKTPTQPYVKRVRGGGGGGGGSSAASSSSSQLPSMVKMEQKPMLDSMAFLQQLQQSGGLNEFNAQNFLDSLPKSSEVINCNSGLNNGEHDMEDGENHHVEAASSSSSDEPVPQAESPEHQQQSEQNDQLAAFVSSLTSSNPMMFAMLNAAGGTAAASTAQTAGQNAGNQNSTGAESPVPETCESPKDPSSFSLSEGHCAAQLMSMALDLEMTMSYHRRRVDIELCFESNRTAEKSGGRGKVICLTDLGKEIRITERVNGAVCDTELWTKTDFNQFHWAIRGKCQKCFNKQ